jgi:predicted GIY-YIG superfamily endonuclease
MEPPTLAAGATVYRLRSLVSGRPYTGITTKSILNRLERHNAGDVTATRDDRPWHVESAFWFRDKARAYAFERYLKSGSGHAFAKRHF